MSKCSHAINGYYVYKGWDFNFKVKCSHILKVTRNETTTLH